MNEKTPFWRVPIVWLVIALPAVAIVAGIAMVVISSRGGSIDSVADPVRRTAQVQVADVGPDAEARARKLSAVLRSQDGVVELLPVTGDFDREQPLQLFARHPTEAARDVRLVLQPTATGWRAKAALEDTHDWNLEAGDETRRWRIVGRLPRAQYAARLAPALTEATGTR